MAITVVTTVTLRPSMSELPIVWKYSESENSCTRFVQSSLPSVIIERANMDTMGHITNTIKAKATATYTIIAAAFCIFTEFPIRYNF